VHCLGSESRGAGGGGGEDGGGGRRRGIWAERERDVMHDA